MGRIRTVLSLAVTLMTAPTVAMAADSCQKLPPFPHFSSTESRPGCLCGSQLKNLSVTLSRSFKVRAACYLRWPRRDDSDAPIELGTTRVSLDRYTDGRLPYGEILLSGSATLSGVLKYEPGPAGDLWFFPVGEPIAAKGTAFSSAVSPLRLSRAYLFKDYSPHEFRVPSVLRQSYCWSAQATLKVDDIWVLIGGTDQSGAFPVKYSVISATTHRACK
jgi:hypothetical protein